MQLENKITQQQLKDRELFNKIAEDYAGKDTVQSTAIVRKHRLIKCLGFLLEKKENIGTLFEIGCGVGAPSWHLDGLYDKYVGIDHSAALIKQAELRKKSSKVSFIAADLLNLKISLKADVIFADGVLHHITDLDMLMKSLKTVAAPGAYFVAREPHSMNPIVQFMRWTRKKIDPSYSKDQCFFKPSRLIDLLAKHDFEEISYKYIGFLSTPFGEVILKPQWLFLRLAKLTILIDSVFDNILPQFLKFLSWNMVVMAKFPKTTESCE